MNYVCKSSSSFVGGNDTLEMTSHPERAVNGTVAADYAFHTNPDPHSWWYIDLGKSYDFSRIKIWNRQRGGTDRAKTLEIIIAKTMDDLNDGLNNGDRNKPGKLVGYSNDGNDFGATLEVKADPGQGEKRLKVTTGRYVGIRLREVNFLHLAQVEIYGSESGGAIPNIPFPAPSSGDGSSGMPFSIPGGN